MALKFLNDGYFAGKVGIGTPSPSYTLDVEGEVRILNTIGSDPFIVQTPYDRVGKFISTDSGAFLAIQDNSSTDNGVGISVSGNVLTLTTGGAGRVDVSSAGAVKFRNYDSTNLTGTPTYLLGTDASGNIVKTNTVPGSAAGPYLPLAGGTLTGGLIGTFAGFTQGVYDNVNGLRLLNPGGGSYVTSASSVTGAIKITLPVSWTNTMMRMTIKVYEYTTNESFTIVFGGYNYSSGTAWYNHFAYIESSAKNDRNFTVRFGHDGTKCCVYIGELASSWSYPQVFVTEFEAGYNAYTASTWNNGWGVGFEASAFGTITQTETNTQANNWARNGQNTYFSSGSGNVGIGTTSPNTKLQVSALNSNYVNLTGGFSVVKAEEGYGLYMGVAGTGNSWIQSATYNNGTTYPLILNGAGGNVGIGTTTPGYKLDVNGTFHASGDSAIDGNLTLGSAKLLKFGGNGARIYGDNANNFLTFDTNSLERMRITSAGGISFGSTGTAYGTSGQILKSNANASPTWVDASTVIGGPYVTLATAQTISGVKTFSANNIHSDNTHVTFGPNSTWSSYLRVGGNGHTATGTEMASVATTDGNLHLDSANSGNGIYLNYYAGTDGTRFGSGAGTIVAHMTSAGSLSMNGDLTVSGGDIILGGTGRIQGIDTVSAGTDAANRNYVDTKVASVGGSTTIASTGGTTPAISAITGAVNSGSSILATGAQIQTAINTALLGVLSYQGTWNASTNSPTLASGTGTPGYYYIVSVAGSTNLDGITDWAVGDWAVFSDLATDAWQKIDNTQVGNVTGSGANNRLAFWNSTSNISSDGNFTISGTRLIGTQLAIGDGTDGYFYSDTAGRTAFASGDFYIQSSVANYFNYATQIYLGDTTGDSVLFRGSTITGTNWGITPAGLITAASGFTTVSGKGYSIGSSRIVYYDGTTYLGNIDNQGSGSTIIRSAGNNTLTLDTSNNATFAGDLTVLGGDITLVGTGRIQGIDTVSATTDAANKAYVDAHGGGLGPFLPIANPTFTGTLTGPTAVVTGNIKAGSLSDDTFTRFTNPDGASYVTQASSVTGAIAITLPIWTSPMVRMTIKVYEYAANESFTIDCGGHNSGTDWYNEFAYIVGNPGVDRRFTVRFGRTAGGLPVVYIGELASTWSYPQVFVTDVQVGFAGYSVLWASGWAVGFRTGSFEGVSRTIYNSQVGYALSTNTANTSVLRDGSGNFAAGTITGALNGNASTATEAQNNYFYVRGTDPSIRFVDSTDNSTRWVHHNGGSIGFLDSTGNWVLRCDNSASQFYGTVSATNLSGTNTGDQTSVTGSAGNVGGLTASMIVSGGSGRKSTSVSTFAGVNEPTGAYYGNNVTGAPTTDWINYLNTAGNSWQSSNNYSFQLTHAFHSDNFWVSRTTNGAQSSARLVIDSGNISTQTVANATNALPLAGGVMTGNVKRSSAIVGFLEGSYNNVGDNAANTNPIYTIGSSYNPASTTLSNMYGVGYSHSSASFLNLTGVSGWGMYVASGGTARVWLGGGDGNISGTGNIYASGGDSTEWNTAYDNRITSLTTNGTSGVATLISNVLNIPNYAGGQGVTSVGGTAPIFSSGGTTPDISITAATSGAAGSMSATDKAKLDGIAAGAQVNVGTNIAQGTRTTTTVPVTSSTGTNATLAAATTSLAGVMTSADKTKLDGIATGAQVNVGTNLSYTTAATTGAVNSSTGSSATVPAATTALAGLLTGADKTKLDGIAAGAQVNVATNLSKTTSTTDVTINSSTGTNVAIGAASTSVAGVMTKVLYDNVIANNAKVSNVTTNLGYTASTTNGVVTSSDGTNATLPLVVSNGNAGLMIGSDKLKLDGIAAGAQVNVATNLGITAGTTAGPIVTSSTGTNATLPTASATASGVVTTGAQTWAGTKTFSSAIYAPGGNSTEWNTAYTDRNKWDGGAAGLIASTGRASLGGTTLGENMFILTNPSAITFPRFNANNTVSALSASDFRTAIGAGTGGGDVSGSGAAGQVTFWNGTSSVTGENDLYWDSANNELGIGTNNPNYSLHVVASDPTLRLDMGSNDVGTVKQKGGILSLCSQASNTVGGKIEIISLTNSSSIRIAEFENTGRVQLEQYGSGSFTGTAAKMLAVTDTGIVIEETLPSSGTVTSVAATSGGGISINGSPITTSGTLIITNTDKGSSQAIFKNVAVSGQSDLVADTNNDTLTLATETGLKLLTNASTDTITYSPQMTVMVTSHMDHSTNNSASWYYLPFVGEVESTGTSLASSFVTPFAGYIRSITYSGAGNGTPTAATTIKYKILKNGAELYAPTTAFSIGSGTSSGKSLQTLFSSSNATFTAAQRISIQIQVPSPLYRAMFSIILQEN